jgi:hypothetical protein
MTDSAARPGRSGGSGGLRRAVVGPDQPVAEMFRGLSGRSAVKRHQSRRHAGDANDVGAPPVLIDRTGFDQVGTSSNELFEPMDRCCHS